MNLAKLRPILGRLYYTYYILCACQKFFLKQIKISLESFEAKKHCVTKNHEAEMKVRDTKKALYNIQGYYRKDIS